MLFFLNFSAKYFFEFINDYLMPAHELNEQRESLKRQSSSSVSSTKIKPKWNAPLEDVKLENTANNTTKTAKNSKNNKATVKHEHEFSANSNTKPKSNRNRVPPPLPKNPPSQRKTRKSKEKNIKPEKPIAYMAKIPKEYRLEPSTDPAFFNGDQYVPQYYHNQLSVLYI